MSEEHDDGLTFREASEMDMNKAVVSGYDSVTTVLLAALDRAGAKKVRFGYREEDADDLWPEKPITAYCEVFWRVKTGYDLGEMRTVEEVIAERGTVVDNPGKAIVEALARVVRFAGGKVTMMSM